MRRSRIAAAAALAALLAARLVRARPLNAADIHPAGYPTVAAVEYMGKMLETATKAASIKFQVFPGRRWAARRR